MEKVPTAKALEAGVKADEVENVVFADTVELAVDSLPRSRTTQNTDQDSLITGESEAVEPKKTATIEVEDSVSIPESDVERDGDVAEGEVEKTGKDTGPNFDEESVLQEAPAEIYVERTVNVFKKG